FGRLTISSDMDIVGQGNYGSGPTIDAAKLNQNGFNDKAILISQGNVTISNVVIENGHPYGLVRGGGLQNSCNLTLNYVTVANNSTTPPFNSHGPVSGNGGGIFNSGALTLNFSVVASNQAEGSGGGIYNAGTLTVNASTVRDNNCTSRAGA